MISPSLVRITTAEIMEVDRQRWTCSACDTSSDTIYHELPIAPIYLGTKGSGMFYLPETGAIVTVAVPVNARGMVTGGKGFILCGAAVMEEKDDPEDDPDEPPDEVSTGLEANEYTEQADFRNLRPILAEGDLLLSTSGGNRVILRSGGVIEIGTELAQRYYIPVQNILRDMASRYELQTAGGRILWETREDETQWGNTTYEVRVDTTEGAENDGIQEVEVPNTPTSLKFYIREFAQDTEPVVSIEMGRVQPFTPAPVAPGRSAEDIVYQMVVNKKYKLYIDKYGNYKQLIEGHTILKYRGDCKTVYTAGSTQEVMGRFLGRYGSRRILNRGDEDVEITGNLSQTVGGNITKTCKGNLDEIIEGTVTKTYGDVSINSTGALALDSDNFTTITSGADLETVVGGNATEIISRSKNITVSNTSLDLSGYSLECHAGDVDVHSVLGRLNLTAGLSKLIWTCKLTLDPITQSLNIAVSSPTVGSPAGGELEINPSGITLAAGPSEVSIDNAGSVSLGTPLGVGHGYVVTTMTHPVCFVTGLPIKGASLVSAGGLPVPQLVPPISTFVKLPV